VRFLDIHILIIMKGYTVTVLSLFHICARTCISEFCSVSVQFRQTRGWYNIHKHARNIWDAQFLMVSGRARRKVRSGTARVKFIYYAVSGVLLSIPCSTARKDLHRVPNTVTLVSFTPVFAFTTADAFLANINWHYNNSLHSLWKYLYLKLFLRRVCFNILWNCPYCEHN
jgi:hypothetical protein